MYIITLSDDISHGLRSTKWEFENGEKKLSLVLEPFNGARRGSWAAFCPQIWNVYSVMPVVGDTPQKAFDSAVSMIKQTAGKLYRLRSRDERVLFVMQRLGNPKSWFPHDQLKALEK